jgi:hypothetical protein
VAILLHFPKEEYFIANSLFLKKKMLKKELIFLSKFVKLAYNMKGCSRFSSSIFLILPILAKCMPG